MGSFDVNIIVALVSAGSALLGVLAGGLFSSRAATRQLKAEASRQRHSEKVAAYSEFIRAYSYLTLQASRSRIFETQNPYQLDISDEEFDASVRFSSAYAIAAMHAPKNVRIEMATVADLALKHAEGENVPELPGRMAALQEVLHRDINTES